MSRPETEIDKAAMVARLTRVEKRLTELTKEIEDHADHIMELRAQLNPDST